MAKWYQFRLFLVPHIIKSMPSLTSQPCGDSLPVVCLSRQDGAIHRPPKHSWSSYRLTKEASVKADCCTFDFGTYMGCGYFSDQTKWIGPNRLKV